MSADRITIARCRAKPRASGDVGSRNTKGSVINTYDHPALGWMLDHWHAMIALSGCLLLLGAFTLMTHWGYRKDEAARLETYRRAGATGASDTRR